MTEIKTPRKSSYRGPLYFYEFYLQEFYQVLLVNSGEKFHYASRRRREKGTILKNTLFIHLRTTQHSDGKDHRIKEIERDSIFMDKKTQYGQNVRSSQIDL